MNLKHIKFKVNLVMNNKNKNQMHQYNKKNFNYNNY